MKEKLTLLEKRRNRLVQIDVKMEAWDAKRRRAENAIRKLRRKRQNLIRVISKAA